MTDFDLFEKRRGVYPALSLTRAEAVSRALSWRDAQVWYELGRGGRNPAGTPWAPGKRHPDRRTCDCSGFSAWVLGHDRRQYLPPGHPLAGEDGETWFDTTTIVEDALKHQVLYTLVPKGEAPLPGDLLVYPRNPALGLRYGHVAVVTRVRDGFKRGARARGREWWRYLSSVDCSTGRGDRAIRERDDAKLWADRFGYLVRYLHLEAE